MSDDSDSEAQAMALAMGFSSFGAAPARKKRKFNPATDSFIEGDELAEVDRGGKKGKGSGGNQVPLGKVRVMGEKKESVRNEDEIDLGGDDEEEGLEHGDLHEGGTEIDQRRTEEVQDPRLRIRRSVSPRAEEGNEDGPQYMDTSEAAPTDNPSSHYTSSYTTTTTLPYIHPQNHLAIDAQAQIDSILGLAPLPPGSATLSYPPPPGAPSYPSLNANQFQSMISDRILARDAPPSFNGSNGSGGRGRGRDQWSDTASMTSAGTGRGGGRGGHGGHNPRWYIDYYDLSFNENPWAKLEKAMGLKSVGTWVERPERQSEGQDV